jgi:hypothetical protein
MNRLSLARRTQVISCLQATVALHFAHYNLVRLHKTLRVTPAMAAGVTDRLWSLKELVDRTSIRTLPKAAKKAMAMLQMKYLQLYVWRSGRVSQASAS